MEPKNYQEIGLPVAPGQWLARALIFSPPARTLLLLVSPCTAGADARRIFVRAVDEDRYRELVLPTPSSVLNVVTSEHEPVAFAWITADADRNDQRLLHITLPEGVISELPPVQGDGVSRRVWVSRLLSASGDGQELYVIVGCEPFPVPGASHHWIDYKLAVMSVATGEFRVISALPTPYA